MHRTATPLLVSGTAHSAETLPRHDLRATGDGGYDERWIQDLVHHNPSVLPIGEIEPAFSPLSAVCTELPLASGYLDNLLVTPRGDLVAVECKLWRNPEAQRKVVAQVIDYAKDLQKLSYTELQDAIRAVRKEPAFSLYRHSAMAAGETDAALDEARFVDAVTRNLRRGRCLLIILGDGITEGVEAMTEFLQQHAGLHFALALVQLGVYDLPGTDRRIVVPSIPVRTTNIVRGIVHVADERATVSAPPPKAISERSVSLTEEELFAAWDRVQPGTTDRMIRFLAECEDLQVQWYVKKALTIFMIVGSNRVTPFSIGPDGRVETTYTGGQKHLTRTYAKVLADVIPGAQALETEKTCYVKNANGSRLTIWQLLDHAKGVYAALEELNRTMMAADQDGS